MRIGKQTNDTSAICTSDAHTITIRGRDLSTDLMGHVGFSELFWLLLTGQLPDVRQRSVLDATLVAIAEHGLVPSVQASRMTFAAAPESLQGAVAAGILGCGSVVFGSSQAAGRFLADISRRVQEGQQIESASLEAIREYNAAGQPIPGYGHPQHSDFDPRALRLLEIATSLHCAGPHVAIAREVCRLLPQTLGKALALNVSGAIPAVLLDVGFPLAALKGVPILARTAGLIAHLVEEQQRPIGFVMSNVAANAIGYDGPSAKSKS